MEAFDAEVFELAFEKSAIYKSKASKKTKEVMSRVAKACDVSMLRRRNRRWLLSMYWWNTSIATLRKECIRARKLAQRARGKRTHPELESKYKEARAKLNKAIKNSKRKCEDELRDKVDEDPWGKPYKVVMKKFRSQLMPTPTCPTLLKRIVETLFPLQEGCEHRADYDTDETIPPITVEELRKACSKVGMNKAPGMDGIPNVALKAVIRVAPEMFLEVYNTCLSEGVFPEPWK